MIEALTSLGYDLVESTWHLAAVTVKFYILTVGFRLRDDLNLKNFSEKILEESKNVLIFLLGSGAVNLLLGLELRPFVPIFSEFVALVYLGYLFWEF